MPLDPSLSREIDRLLPKVVFLTASPSWKGRTQLANLLADHNVDTLPLSFEAPLRGACRGAFFFGDPSLDLGAAANEQLVIPGLPSGRTDGGAVPTVRSFQLAFHHFLSQRYGAGVLGRLAVRAIQEDENFFSHFVFDDAGVDLMADMVEVCSAIGPSFCLHCQFGTGPAIEIKSLRSINIPELTIGPDLPQLFLSHLEQQTAGVSTP